MGTIASNKCHIHMKKAPYCIHVKRKMLIYTSLGCHTISLRPPLSSACPASGHTLSDVLAMHTPHAATLLTASDHRHPTKPSCKINANISVPCWSHYRLFLEGKVPQTSFYHQTYQAVRIEHKVILVCVFISDDGMHAPYLQADKMDKMHTSHRTQRNSSKVVLSHSISCYNSPFIFARPGSCNVNISLLITIYSITDIARLPPCLLHNHNPAASIMASCVYLII